MTTERAYIDVAGSLREANAFETALLSAIERRYLPPCALAVLDGGEPTPEYWSYLIGQLRLSRRG